MNKHNFTDNVVNIYAVTNGASKGDAPKYVINLKRTMRCDYETLGLKRKWDAAQAQIEITDVVSVPLWREITTQDVLMFMGSDEQYDIYGVQHVTDDYPYYSRLTLSRRLKRYDCM